MYPQLTKRSFLKKKPGEFILSPYKNGIRDSIIINDTAMDILSLCNGSNSIDQIIDILKDKYKEDRNIVKKNVEDFLKPLIDCGVIENSCGQAFKCNILGSDKIFYPDILIWEVTNYCPLNCRHCYLPSKGNDVFSDNDIKKVFDIIDKIGIYQIQLTGGEALSHPKINYIIDELVKRGIVICISTSGMIFNDLILEGLLKLKSIRGSFVRLSIDGNEKTHNYIRRNENAYEKALDFLKKMKENKIPCQVGTSILSQPKKELRKLTSLVKKNGAYLIEMGLVSVQGNAKKNNLLPKLSQKDLNLFLKELNEEFSDESFIVKLPTEKQLLKNCGAGCKLIVIKANKDITICPTAELKLGNVETQSIDEIMENWGSKFNDITSPNKEICGDCKNQEECKGCISRALILKETVKKCPWFESCSNIFEQFE